MTKEIVLTQGKVALVDDQDFDALNIYSWQALAHPTDRWYAKRGCRKDTGAYGLVYMHVQIMGGIGIDHIDTDGLNNQRVNLRFATNSENSRNTRKQSNNTSGWKGVNFHKPSGKWMAKIMIHGNRIHIGLFSNSEEAAKAYDDAAKKYHGEFARFNFPEKG